MKEEEFQYIVRLLDGLNKNIYEEILGFYYDIAKSRTCRDLSSSALEFFRENLKNNPVTASNILTFFQQQLPQDASQVVTIQELYLDVLDSKVNDLTKTEQLLSLISLIQFADKFVPKFIEKILLKIPDDTFRQHSKQIFISLIAHKRPELLLACSDLLKRNEAKREFKLTPEYMLQLCYLEKTHWLLKAAEVYKHQVHDISKVTFKINNFTKQILILALIDLVNNQDNYDFLTLVDQLQNIFSILNTYASADKQLQFYITEIKRQLTIIKFCLENNCKLLSMSVFGQVLMQSSLSVVSQLCRLSQVDRYKVSRMLNVNNEFLNELKSLKTPNKDEQSMHSSNWDVITYNSYCAITTAISIIMNSSKDIQEQEAMSSALDELKRLILSPQPIINCIEVMENVFSCLFLRHEYFSCDEDSQNYPCGAYSDCSYFVSKKLNKLTKHSQNSNVGFVCSSLTAQMVLNTLKCCLTTLEENVSSKPSSVEVSTNVSKRLTEMVTLVNNSLWKLHLVTSLTPECPTPNIRLCMDYFEVGVSSEDEEGEGEIKALKKRPRGRKKPTVIKSDADQLMVSSSLSTNGDGSLVPRESSIEFISLMLASPNSLVALALHHNDFTKANQIIEMFDLADAEIATEVIFTEQLGHLVTKIRNILLYKADHHYPMKELPSYSVVSTEVMSLVEGFLASNAAPNSIDIVELSRRHPHLLLYNHQNAPLINAIDILISTGLNREITYGLINVVERKLSVVRNSTEVASKKTNFIRFIEEVASVTFEIFGHTEKTFDYVDSVCGIINDCRIPLNHKEFSKLNQLSKELQKCCTEFADIVKPRDCTSLDPSILQKYHQTYMNIVSISDKDLCNIAEMCPLGNKKNRVHYLRMCYIYAKNVAQLDAGTSVMTDSSVESSYFSILEKHLHQLVGDAIYKSNVPITSLETICKKLNINFIHKLILNFCPSIKLMNVSKEASEANFNNLLQMVYEFKNDDENLFIEPVANFAPVPEPPDQQSLTYIVLQNWVLAHIVKKIHTTLTEHSLQQSIDSRTKFLNNYMDLERFKYLKDLFGGNRYLATLHTCVNLDELFQFMPKLIDTGKLLRCLHIIDALSENQLLTSANLMNLRDLILFKLAIHPRVEMNWKYCKHLKCPVLKVNLVLNNLGNWPLEGALEVLDELKFLLDPVAEEEGLYSKCSDWIKRIPLYDQIASIMGESSWYIIYEKSIDSPEEIVNILMDSQQFKLCLEWADVHEITENIKNLIVSNRLRQLFEYASQATPELVEELLSRLPTSQAVSLIQNDISKIRNVEVLQRCVNYVSENSYNWKAFQNIKIGLQIMLDIELNLRHMFWDILEMPLVMIEQFLMNAKLEKLTAIINKIGVDLNNDPSGDNLYYNIKSIESVVISRNSVDALLRFYAEKALDMKNPRKASIVQVSLPDDALLLSIDSINLETAARPFVMPEEVPTKEQWVQDYSTDKCMMCRIAIFSMIIRRHHCRRCGRVVCHACSRHRMQVPTYPPGVKFRVCEDCYTQSVNKKATEQEVQMMSSNSDSAGSGVSYMDWCLSASASRNEAVRAEFSYEFSPNVTLCLSIMKLHSINLDYPRFLLDRSDEVAREVSAGGDPRLLVRARRSLLLAAEELYARAPVDTRGENAEGARISRVAETGAAHAARCLANGDAMAILVKHACQHLLPPQGALPGHFVRSLLEAEKWELALEIATKSGLPRNGVLAAWGKACLKAGCYKQAREKFAHCFKSTIQFNASTEALEDCEYGREAAEMSSSPFVNRTVHRLRLSERSSSLYSLQSDGRPRSNPPLLNEIVNMLENMNYPVNQQLLSKAESIKTTNEKLASMNTNKKKIILNEPALNIMHALASVRKIKQGDYSDFYIANTQNKKPKSQGLLRRSNSQIEPKSNDFKKLDPFFYKECVYYLTNYGSHVANIAFFLAHSNMAEVLKYCYENMVDKETFTESVYMECLKKDKVNELLRCMLDVDSTLERWSEYITHICRTLEMSSRLDALYALQCGTLQHARASATCARLYARPLPRTGPLHATLHARQHHLASAAHHLAQCVPITTTNNTRNNIQKSFHLQLDKATIDKHLTTITRQLELAKFLFACEESNRLTEKMMHDVMPLMGGESSGRESRPITLFGSNTDRCKLAAVALAAGATVDEGFGLAYRIITDNKLDSMKVYSHVARYLVQADRFVEVKTLAQCVRNSKETGASTLSDRVLEVGVSAIVSQCEARSQLFDEQAEVLIEDIHSISIKISCYLKCKILTTAYITAMKHDRTNDLRRILREAERLGHDQVRNACQKRLAAKNVL